MSAVTPASDPSPGPRLTTRSRLWTVSARSAVAATGLALMLAGCATTVGNGTASGQGTPAVGGPSGSAGTGSPMARTASPQAHRSPASPSRSASSPVLQPGAILTAASNRETITLAVGQRLTVYLVPLPGGRPWERPRLTGSGLRLVSVLGGFPAQGPMQAVFVSVAPGIATLSSLTTLTCAHAHPPCMVAARVWTVQIIIR